MSRILYRVAFLVDQSSEETQTTSWKWRSTILTSSHALFTLLKTYQHLPPDHVLGFFGATEEDMEDMLNRQNQGKMTTSLPAAQLLSTRKVNQQDVRRLALEVGTSDGYDEPYIFTFPSSWVSAKPGSL